MDHTYINEHNVVDRYEMGKLSEQECVSFNDHFADCLECQSQLMTIHNFREALKAVALEDGRLAKPKTLRPLTTAPAMRWTLVGVAVSIVLSTAVFFLLREMLRLKDEVSRANKAASDWQQRYEDQRQTAAELQRQLGKQEHPVLASIFSLDATQSGGRAISHPVNYLVISRLPQAVVLSPEFHGQKYESYRATLSQSGQVLWNADGLRPVASKALNIILPSHLFHQGDYLLTLEGVIREGTYVTTGHYAFRVMFKE
jgi:hypothetical protein